MNTSKLSARNLQVELPSFDYSGCYILVWAIRDSIFGEQYSDIDVFDSTENFVKFYEQNLKSGSVRINR